MTNTFLQKFIVELSDITPNFGLKATSVLKYYQETFARYCAKYHVAGYDVYQMGLKWVFGQTVVEYLDVIPIWNEEVIAKVYISAVKKLRIYINFEIETKRGVVAKGQSIAYILDLETSRPKPVDEIINHFDINTDDLNDEMQKVVFTEDGALATKQEHTVTFSDVDYNNHTNNIAYVAMGFEGMSPEFVKKYYPKKVEIKYLQETFLNDVLKSEIYKNVDSFEYKIINTKDESLVCLIKAYWKQNTMTPEKFFEILKEINGNKAVIQ